MFWIEYCIIIQSLSIANKHQRSSTENWCSLILCIEQTANYYRFSQLRSGISFFSTLCISGFISSLGMVLKACTPFLRVFFTFPSLRQSLSVFRLSSSVPFINDVCTSHDPFTSSFVFSQTPLIKWIWFKSKTFSSLISESLLVSEDSSRIFSSRSKKKTWLLVFREKNISYLTMSLCSKNIVFSTQPSLGTPFLICKGLEDWPF